METPRHRFQMELLIRGLYSWAADQGDVFVSGNQFVYFNVNQLRGQDFRGPDVFVVRGVSQRERKSWVVWNEGKGPDVVIEFISDSTAENDKGAKKTIYQDQLRVPDYFWMDLFNPEDRCGFTLSGRRYVPIPRDAEGCLPVPSLGLRLCLWSGEYLGITATWLRWAGAQGLLLLPEEAERQRADEEQRRANEAQRRADEEQQRANGEQRRAEAAEQEIMRLRAEIDRLRSA